VLITESADEFHRIRDTLIQEIKPRGIIEQIYVDEFATLVWESWRLRRCKAAIINSAFSDALTSLFWKLFMQLGFDLTEARRTAKDLTQQWFTNQSIRENAAKVLASFKLDESAIEAEALRTSAGNLEQLDRWLASLESRRNKLLRNIAEYRGGLARQLKENSDRIIDGKIVTLEITRPVSHRPRPDHDE
jgi:hypothetical protein